MNNGEIGKTGETMAVAFLQEKGYKVLEQNWRYKKIEIDIIATKNNVLHIIEVKTRRTIKFGHPEESITERKMTQLKKGAEIYQFQYPEWKEISFDILAITLRKGNIDFWLNEDVYF